MKWTDVMKYLMVVAAIAAIAAMFPPQLQTQMHYAVGEKWRYDDLIAPFDIPIQKSKEEMEAERAGLADAFHPVFILDRKVAAASSEEFEKRLDQKLKEKQSETSSQSLAQRKNQLEKTGKALLSELYRNGIIEESAKNFEENWYNVMVDEKPTLTDKNDLISLEEGRDWVADTLQQMNLVGGGLVATIVQSVLAPNIRYDEDLSNRLRLDAENRLSAYKGIIPAGDLIVGHSDLITRTTFDRLKSYESAFFEQIGSPARRWSLFAGYLLLTGLIIGVYLLYLQLHAEEIYQKWSSLAFMLIWPVLFGFLITVVEGTPNLSAYMIPFCIVPIILKNFYSDRVALFTHIVVVLIASFLSREGYEFTFLQILAGIVAILSVKKTLYWNQFFSSIFFIFCTYVLGCIGLDLVSHGNVSEVNWKGLIHFVIAAILTLLAYPLIPLLEGIFGYTSSIKLIELADMNRPLLKELSMKAPGTFQHSLQVANLSEAAADAIGANTQLVKTAALYHDIGKMVDPEYFIENQKGFNPHEGISEKESAAKIIAHVTEGVKMAKKARLPKVITDFISSHHGTTLVNFFYINHKKANPDEVVSESDFQYPGPLPKSKEEAIMMIADSLEAAAKSLKSPVGQEIDDLVDKIINGKIEKNQLVEADISFKELGTIRHVFKSLLRNIYHVRIEYPEDTNKTI